MAKHDVDQIIMQLENYLECLKQFNYFASLARTKKFSAEDESQFLEVKSVLVQELELILASIECVSPTKEEVLALISSAPSIRYLSEMADGVMRGVENQWHKIFIGWVSILGQLKVQQHQKETRPMFGFFGKKSKKLHSGS
ncbi:MAG: hypothetical protein ABIP71_05490 [Verrucomicrobiota bacterium]